MGARQSSPGIGGGCGGSSSLTATATATGSSSSGAGTSTNSSPRVQGTSNENNGATPSSSTSGVAGFGGLVSSSLCQNGSTRTRPIASNSTGNGGPGSSGGGQSDWRQRARSLTNVINSSGHHHHPHNITTANGQPFVTVSPLGYSSFGFSASPDSFTSIDDLATFGRVFSAHSLPVQLVPFNGIKCPVCSKAVLPDDVECHLVMCLTKPRISYNEDILTEDKGECVICLDDLSQGDTIARLPCLCIYHKSCIDAWFEVNRSCPEHPSD